MKGLKIRVPNSDLYIAMIKALGADATPMSISEVYQSLVQGVIDGAENNWPSYESGRHFEVATYYSLTRHVIAPEVLVMSARRWEKLSEADREEVRRAAKDSVPFMRTLWDARVDAARTKLIEAGVKVNEIADPAAFAAAMRPVWDKYIVSDAQRRLVAPANLFGECTARVKAAAGGRVGRAWHIPLQDDALAHPLQLRVGRRHGRQERPRIRMQWPVEDAVAAA
jgi:TRAP-type C4-dicarboxylate transport system substrate-binding protein